MSADAINPKLKSLDNRDALADRERKSAVIGRFFESRLRLTQLRLLVAIADLGQLKRVASALNITPPAVSKQLAEMEGALGEPVLARMGNRMEFTALGELLVRRAREVLAQLERARIEVDELCSGAGGVVGIGAVASVASILFPPLYLALKSRAPTANIRLHEGRFAELAPMLAEGSLDIVFARDTTRASVDGFMERVVMNDPLAVVCGAHHPLAASADLSWDDLDGVPWILPIRGSSTFMHLESLLLRHKLQIPRGSIESGSWSGSVGLLQVHPFVAVFPLGFVRPFLQTQQLAVLPLGTEGIQDTVKAVWRLDEQSSLVSLLIGAVEQHVQVR